MDLKAEIARLTEEYGGTWGINHTRRLLRLIEVIGQGHDYDSEALWLAAHLHDWGAYAPWEQAGVDHVLCSGQVAEAYLSERNCSEKLKVLVAEERVQELDRLLIQFESESFGCF